MRCSASTTDRSSLASAATRIVYRPCAERSLSRDGSPLRATRRRDSSRRPNSLSSSTGERPAQVRTSGHLPGDRQVPQVERPARQDPLRPPQGVGADAQDGAAQDLTVLRRLVRLLAPADDRQARPTQAGERVSDGVVQASVVTGQVPGTDPVRGRDTSESRWIDREIGMQVRLQRAGAWCRQRCVQLDGRAGLAFRRPRVADAGLPRLALTRQTTGSPRALTRASGCHTRWEVSSTHATAAATTSAGVSVSKDIW
ncbi:hypothetical protein SUDANB150_03633 [Streptomyces sp. enrichment culture]